MQRHFTSKYELAVFIEKILCSDRHLFVLDHNQNEITRYKEATDSQGNNRGTIFERCFFYENRFSFQCKEKNRSFQNTFMGRMEDRNSQLEKIYSVTIDYSGHDVTLVVKNNRDEVQPTHILRQYLHEYTIDLLNATQADLIPEPERAQAFQRN